MRSPSTPSRFALSIRTLAAIIALLLGSAIVAVQETPVDEEEVTLVAAASRVDDLDLLAEIQEAHAVAARAAAIFEADRIAQEARDAEAARQARIEETKAREQRASRAAARVARQPSGNCTTGSSNPGVADPCGCESSDVQGWSGNGRYYGKYQYGKSDWAANGGDPAKYGNATEAEQDAVAANTKYDAWPNC